MQIVLLLSLEQRTLLINPKIKGPIPLLNMVASSTLQSVLHSLKSYSPLSSYSKVLNIYTNPQLRQQNHQVATLPKPPNAQPTNHVHQRHLDLPRMWQHQSHSQLPRTMPLMPPQEVSHMPDRSAKKPHLPPRPSRLAQKCGSRHQESHRCWL